MATFEDMAAQMKHMSPEEIAQVFSRLQRGELVLNDSGRQRQDETRQDQPAMEGRPLRDDGRSDGGRRVDDRGSNRGRHENDGRADGTRCENDDRSHRRSQKRPRPRKRSRRGQTVMDSHDPLVEQELLQRQFQMQRSRLDRPELPHHEPLERQMLLDQQQDLDLERQEDMLYGSVAVVDEDLLRERLLQSRLTKAMDSATSQEQRSLFAARMMGMADDRAMPGPSDHTPDMDQQSHVPLEQVIPPHLLGHVSQIKQQLQQGNAEMDPLEILAQLGRQMREQQQSVVVSNQTSGVLEGQGDGPQHLEGQAGGPEVMEDQTEILARLGRQLREQQEIKMRLSNQQSGVLEEQGGGPQLLEGEAGGQPLHGQPVGPQQLLEEQTGIPQLLEGHPGVPQLLEGQLGVAQLPAQEAGTPVIVPSVPEGHMVSMSGAIPPASIGGLPSTPSSLSMMPLPQTVSSVPHQQPQGIMQPAFVGPPNEAFSQMVPPDSSGGAATTATIGGEGMKGTLDKPTEPPTSQSSDVYQPYQPTEDPTPHSYGFYLQDTYGLKEKHFQDYFSQFGPVLNVIDKFQYGYGFVEIENLTAAQAHKLVGSHNIEGINIVVEMPVQTDADEDGGDVSLNEQSAIDTNIPVPFQPAPVPTQSQTAESESEVQVIDIKTPGQSGAEGRKSRSPSKHSSRRSHSPGRRSRSPRRRRSPSSRSRSRRSRSPRRRSRSPRRRSRSPRKHSHRSRSPRRTQTPSDRNNQAQSQVATASNQAQTKASNALTSRPIIEPPEKKTIQINLQKSPEGGADPNKWKCHVCNVACKAEWSWNLHIKGARHKEQIVADILKLKEGSKKSYKKKSSIPNMQAVQQLAQELKSQQTPHPFPGLQPPMSQPPPMGHPPPIMSHPPPMSQPPPMMSQPALPMSLPPHPVTLPPHPVTLPPLPMSQPPPPMSQPPLPTTGHPPPIHPGMPGGQFPMHPPPPLGPHGNFQPQVPSSEPSTSFRLHCGDKFSEPVLRGYLKQFGVIKQLTMKGVNLPWCQVEFTSMTGRQIDRMHRFKGLSFRVEKAPNQKVTTPVSAPVPQGKVADSTSRGLATVEMMIPGDKVGLVIGQGGETIKKLQEKAGVKMMLIQESNAVTQGNKPLQITGEPSKIEEAKQLIKELLQSKDNTREGRKLIIFNNLGFSNQQLRQHFGKFGKIEGIDFTAKKTAIVKFKHVADTKAAFLAGEDHPKCKKGNRRHQLGDFWVDVQRHVYDMRSGPAEDGKQATDTMAAVAASAAADKAPSTAGSEVQQKEEVKPPIPSLLDTLVLKARNLRRERQLVVRNQPEPEFTQEDYWKYFSNFGVVQTILFGNKSVAAVVLFALAADARRAFLAGEDHPECKKGSRRHQLGKSFMDVSYNGTLEGDKQNQPTTSRAANLQRAPFYGVSQRPHLGMIPSQQYAAHLPTTPTQQQPAPAFVSPGMGLTGPVPHAPMPPMGFGNQKPNPMGLAGPMPHAPRPPMGFGNQPPNLMGLAGPIPHAPRPPMGFGNQPPNPIRFGGAVPSHPVDASHMRKDPTQSTVQESESGSPDVMEIEPESQPLPPGIEDDAASSSVGGQEDEEDCDLSAGDIEDMLDEDTSSAYDYYYRNDWYIPSGQHQQWGQPPGSDLMYEPPAKMARKSVQHQPTAQERTILFVFEIPKTISKIAIKQHFQQFGSVKDFDMVKNTGQVNVVFESAAAALAAYNHGLLVENHSQHTIDGAIVRCKLQSEADIKSMKETAERTLFLKGFNHLTTDEIKAHFSTLYGPVVKIFVLPNRKHAGFLQFKNAQDAAKAFLCGEVYGSGTTQRRHYIGAKFVIVKLKGKGSKKDENETQTSPNKRFFIGGTGYHKQIDLVEYFNQYGIISDVFLLSNKGFGYIEFSRISNYDEARMIGNHNIKGRSIEVKRAKPKGSTAEPPGGTSSGSGSRFYLGGLSNQIQKKDLANFFGKIVSAKITDLFIMQGKGFGYIEFERTSQYEEAKLLGRHVINGCNFECKRAKPREQVPNPEGKSRDKSAEGQSSSDPKSDEASTNADNSSQWKYDLIGQLNKKDCLTEDDLREYFATVGPLAEVAITRKSNRRWYGFVTFEQETKVVGEHNIRGKWVSVVPFSIDKVNENTSKLAQAKRMELNEATLLLEGDLHRDNLDDILRYIKGNYGSIQEFTFVNRFQKEAMAGFLKFKNPSDAEKAWQDGEDVQLSFVAQNSRKHSIGKWDVHVSKTIFTNEEGEQDIEAGTLFVTGTGILHLGVHELQDYFRSRYGPVDEEFIYRYKRYHNSGFLTFNNAVDAQNAWQSGAEDPDDPNMRKHNVEGKVVSVSKKSIHKKKELAAGTLYVKGLGHFSVDKIKAYFNSNYGPIQDLTFPKLHSPGLVKFKNSRDAERLWHDAEIESRDPYTIKHIQIGDHRITLQKDGLQEKYGKKQKGDEDGKDVTKKNENTSKGSQEEDVVKSSYKRYYISGIDNSKIKLTKSDIVDYFRQYGIISDVQLLFYKGFGHVEIVFSQISNYDEAKMIRTHHIKETSVEVKREKPKDPQTGPHGNVPAMPSLPGSLSTPQDIIHSEHPHHPAPPPPLPPLPPAPAPPPPPHHDGRDDQEMHNISKDGPKYFLRGITEDITHTDLKDYFRPFGRPTDVTIIRSKGIGYIQFESASEEVESEREVKLIRFRNHNIKKTLIYCERAKRTEKGVTKKRDENNAKRSQEEDVVLLEKTVSKKKNENTSKGSKEEILDFGPRYFLGGITEDITRQDLKDYFRRFGPLVDVTLIKNKSIGYIQYEGASEEVESEQEENLFRSKHHIKDNYYIYCERANRHGEDVTKKRHENTSRRSQEENDVVPKLFICGFGQRLTDMELGNHFNQFGTLKYLKVIRERGYGFVHYKKLSSYMAAIDAGRIEEGISYHTVKGVDFLCKQSADQPGKGRPTLLKIFGFSNSLTREDIREYFVQFGKLIQCHVQSEGGVGYLEYDDAAAVQEVLRSGNDKGGVTGHLVKGESVYCKGYDGTKLSEDTLLPSRNWKFLHLEGLWSDMTQDNLWDYFERYGKVVDVRVLPDTSFGYVEFKMCGDAQRAMDRGDRVCDGVAKHYISGKNFTAQLNERELPVRQGASTKSKTKLQLGQIPTDIVKDDLHHYFSQYGKLEVYISSDLLRQGFLEYESVQSAERVVEKGRHMVNGLWFRCTYEDDIEGDSSFNYSRFKLEIGRKLPRVTLQNYLVHYGQIKDLMIHQEFAYVQFATMSHAEQAKFMDRKHTIGGITVEVKRAIPKAESTDSSGEPVGRVPARRDDDPVDLGDGSFIYNARYYIANVKGLNAKDLRNYFIQFGPLIDTQYRDERFGFIEYRKLRASEESKVLGRHVIKGIQVMVERSRRKDEKSDSSKSNQSSQWRYYIANIEHLMEEDLSEYFVQYGPVEEVVVIRNPNKKHFAFVTFETLSKEIESQLLDRKHNIRGRRVHVYPSNSNKDSNTQPSETQPSPPVNPEDRHKFHLSGIRDLTKDELEDYFSQYGQVVDITVRGQEGMKKPFGFVKFDWLTSDDDERLPGTHHIHGYEVRVQRKKSQVQEVKLPKGPPPSLLDLSIPKPTIDIKKLSSKRYHIVGVKYLTGLDLREYFSQLGNVVEAKTSNDMGMRHLDRPYGHVAFDGMSKEEEELMLWRMHKIKGVEVMVQRSKPKGLKGTKRFHLSGVMNLTNIDVDEYFSKYGQLVDVTMSGTEGHFKYGFIEYVKMTDEEEVDVLGKHVVNKVLVQVERAKQKGQQAESSSDSATHSDPSMHSPKRQHPFRGSMHQAQASESYRTEPEPRMPRDRPSDSYTTQSESSMYRDRSSDSYTSLSERSMHRNQSSDSNTTRSEQRMHRNQSSDSYTIQSERRMHRNQSSDSYTTRSERSMHRNQSSDSYKTQSESVWEETHSDGWDQIAEVNAAMSNISNIEAAIDDKPTAKLAEKEVDSIVLSNITRGLTEDDMHIHFSKFGQVKELKVMQTKSHGFGFVQFMTQGAADKALRAGDYVKGQWGVSRMYVKGLSFHCEREVGAGAEEEEDVIEIERETPNILEVFRIPEDTESFKNKVHQHFARYGKVVSTRWFFGKNLAKYMDRIGKAGNKCTRMLVEFKDGKAVEEAMKAGVARYPVEGDAEKTKQDIDASGDVVMEEEGDTKEAEMRGDGDGDEDDTKEDNEMSQKPKKVYHEVDGRYIGSTPYDGEFKPYKAKEFSMLFIRNISDQTTEQDLAKYFKKFGAVNEVMQASVSEEENRGVGLVFFRSTKSVKKVLELQGSGGNVKLLVKNSMVECEPLSLDEVPKYKLQRDTVGKVKRARILLNYLRCHCHPCDQHSAPGACTKIWKQHSQGRKHSFTGKYFPDQASCEACMIHFENSEQLANHVRTLRHDVISKHQDLLAEDAAWDREEERQTGREDVHKETNFLRVYRIGDDTSLEEVAHYFTKFGTILSSRWYLPKNVQAEKMGDINCGTQIQIEFEHCTSVDKVMNAGLKHQNPGVDDPRVLIVDHQIRRNLLVSAHPLEDDITRRANDFRTLFIRTTNTRITEGDIRVRFMKFGEIELLLLGHLNILGVDKRHGIVIFKSTNAVKEVLKLQDGNGRVQLMVKNDLVECEAVSSKEVNISSKELWHSQPCLNRVQREGEKVHMRFRDIDDKKMVLRVFFPRGGELSGFKQMRGSKLALSVLRRQRCHCYLCFNVIPSVHNLKLFSNHLQTRRHTFMDAQIKEPHVCKPCMIVFSNGQQWINHRKTMRHEEVTSHLDFIENPQNYGDMTDAHDKVKDKSKEQVELCPSKLPIYCSTCEKWTNSEKDFMDHTKSLSHKQRIQKWDSQCQDKSTRAEKLCNTCQVVLPNAELYQDHLLSWMHVSNADPNVVHQLPRCVLCKLDFPSQQAYKLHMNLYKEKHNRIHKTGAGGSNTFAKGANPPLVKSVEGAGSSGSLSRGSQGSAKRKQQQAQVLPSKLPIYCSICEKWTNSEKVFTVHAQGNKHKENIHQWNSQNPYPHARVEKLCELCQIVLPNEDLYQEHLLSWMHVSYTGPDVVHQAAPGGSKPIYCSICEKWTNSEKVFKLHAQGNKHKENLHQWNSQNPYPHAKVEKLCELCQIVLPNEGLYQDHLLSWMHVSNTGPEVEHQAGAGGSNLFATETEPLLVESVEGTGSSGDLSRGSQGTLPFSPDPAKWMQQQGEMSTAAVSSTGPVGGQTGGQKDKRLSAYQQKRDQITEQFEWSIPDILKENPNWLGEVKGSEFVKPGFNCKVCCKFCAWDREKEGSLSASRSNHCEGQEHRYRDTMTYQVGGLSGTIPGVFCDVCQQFFGFDESQFADSIADHCISLKHHLHIKLYRLKNNLKLPKWLQRPPFDEKSSQYKEASTAPMSSNYPPKSATPKFTTGSRDDTQDSWDRRDYSGQAQQSSNYGSYNEERDQRDHGSDDPQSGNRKRRSLASSNSRSLISNNMRELYQSRMKERKQITEDSQQYGYEYTPGKRTSDGMGYSSFRSQSGSDDGGSYKTYETPTAERSAYRDYEQRESSEDDYRRRTSTQGDYGRGSSTQGSFRQGSSTGGDYGQDSSASSAYTDYEQRERLIHSDYQSGNLIQESIGQESSSRGDHRDYEQRESSTQSDYRHGSLTQGGIRQGGSIGGDYGQYSLESSAYRDYDQRESSLQGDYPQGSSSQGGVRQGSSTSADYKQDRSNSSAYRDSSSQGDNRQASSIQGDRSVPSRYQEYSAASGDNTYQESAYPSSSSYQSYQESNMWDNPYLGQGYGEGSFSESTNAGRSEVIIDPSGVDRSQDKDVEVLDMDMSD